MTNPAPSPPTGLEIAIVGMAGRFPGAPDLAAFWRNLRDGVESIRRFDDRDLLAAGVDPAALASPRYVKAGGALDDPDRFDAGFFGYSPREAEQIDPQQRLLLECAWHALEHAGYDAAAYPGPIGIFAGSSLNSYWLGLLARGALAGGIQDMISNDRDFLATRVAYKLGLTGPAVTVQTACSTSLVALALACQSLLGGGCDMALAGGVSVGVGQRNGYWYEEGGIHAPDGHCRAFDARAQGTVPGSGLGLVVLKRLADALEDRDTIHAVVRAAAVNNDGAGKVGYTAPSVEGQAAVIRLAQQLAEVEPATVGYVEAHGTGTPLGDPVEVAALTRAFRAGAGRAGPTLIGSVKTNIGHLDAAAGVAGLIKTVLALQHGLIPPSLHFQRPNPQIDFAASPFAVSAGLSEWPAGPGPRRAGVSSFGIGGTNAHAVLEQAPAPAATDPARPWQLLPLSARSPAALERATDALAAYLRAHPAANLADVAYTLQVGRRALPYRRALVCRDSAEAPALLEARAPAGLLDAPPAPAGRAVALLFPGQGAQHPGMARALSREQPVFRHWLGRCAELLRPHLGLDIRAPLEADGAPATNDAGASGTEQTPGASGGLPPAPPLLRPDLDQTWLTQPALFAVEYALARLWMSWGVRPQALIGHSVGEYVAACLAGVLSLEDALALVALRGRLMQALPEGAMLSVALPEHELAALLGPGLDLAAVNGPSSCVAAGAPAALAGLRAALEARGVECRPLRGDRAFHSAMVEPVCAPFLERLRAVRLSPPHTPLISNVSGTWITPEQATDPRYWVRQLRQTVRFGDGARELLADPGRVLLEVGPGRTLSSLVRRQLDPPAGQPVLASLPHPQERQPERAALLKAAAQLWLAGVPLDWPRLTAHERRGRLPLPGYPFEPERYWVAAGAGRPARPSGPDAWLYQPSWRRLAPPPPPAHGPRRWLLLLDQRGPALPLADLLRQHGQSVATLRAGPGFAQLGPLAFQIDPRDPAGYQTLLQTLRAADLAPEQVVHAWAAAPDTPAEHSLAGLLWLAQALARGGQSPAPTLWLLSGGLQDVHGEPPPDPLRAALPGLLQALARPGLVCRSIDLPLQPDPRLAAHLLAELLDPAPRPPLAYRGAYRWTQAFEPVPPAPDTPRGDWLRRGGVYLLCGPLGPRQRALAELLAREAGARLALLLPHAHAEDSRGLRADLQARGAAAVLVQQVRLDDPAAVRAAAERAAHQLGPLRGVLVDPRPAGRPWELSDPPGWAAALQTVLRQLDALDAALRGQAPDFALLQSELAGLPDPAGEAALRPLLDAWAARRAPDSRLPWRSVCWEPWRPDQAPGPDLLAALLRRIIAPGAPAQLLVSAADPSTPPAAAAPRPAEPDPPARLYPRPAAQPAYAAPTNEIERRLAAIWQELLGVAPVGIHDDFFALGGDSLLATRLLSRVRDALEVELPLQRLFEIATVAELAQAVAEQLLAEIDPALLAELDTLDPPADPPPNRENHHE